MDHTKLDNLPTIDQVIKFAELYEQQKPAYGPAYPDWKLDQKADFYMGFFASYRVFMSALMHMQKQANAQETKDMLHALEGECHGRLREISSIIMDKYDLKGFKV